VVHEAVQVGGFGGEISAEVGEHMFGQLKGPVKRIGGARIPIPFSIPLEEAYKISPEQVAAKARSFF
jgi:pyruvate dehydrogenase E1 component beta subunit